MVTIKSGKTVKVGTKTKSGKYTYEVQADGSIKNLTTGRTTAAATTQKAMAPAKAASTSKALTRSTAEKKAPAPAKMSAATDTARKMGSTPARETGTTVGGRGSGTVTPATKGGRGSGINPKPVTAGGRMSGTVTPITKGGRGSGVVIPVTTGGRISPSTRNVPGQTERTSGKPVLNMKTAMPFDAIKAMIGTGPKAKLSTDRS